MNRFYIACLIFVLPLCLPACGPGVTAPDTDGPANDNSDADTRPDPGDDPNTDPDPDPDPPPGPTEPTSLSKIDEALAAGEIDDVHALRYKVFSVFGDDRLPDEFKGGTYEEGTHVVDELARRYADLPPDVKEEMTPFILPPDAPGSWYRKRLGIDSKRAPQLQQPEGNFGKLNVVDGDGNDVAVVKWPQAQPGLKASAEVIQKAMEGPDGVWSKLTSLMGRTPPSDADLDPDYSGGDGRFDVYVLPNGSDCYGWTAPHSAGFFQSIFGDSTRMSYTVVDATTIAGDFSGAAYDGKLRANTAHEFMHAIQFAYDLDGPRSDYWWLGDATATWAEHYCFRNDDLEQDDAPAYLKTLDVPLELDQGNRRYGGYLYFFHHVNKFSESILRFVYESAEVADQLEAIDAAVPGGITENWAEFAVANWNEEPVKDYEDDDGLTDGASDHTSLEFSILSGPQDELVLNLSGDGLEPLSAQYFHYEFSDTKIRTILFANGLTFELQQGVPDLFQGVAGDETYYATRLPDDERKGLHVMALVKQNGTWSPESFDLTDVAFASFCQEATTESVEEIVIILANARWKDHERDPVEYEELAPRLFMTNIGCGNWEGNGKHTLRIRDDGDVTDATTTFDTIEFTRDPLSITQVMGGHGQTTFGTQIMPASTLPGVGAFSGKYELATISGSWTHSRTYNDGRCSEQGSGDIDTGGEVVGMFSVAPHLTATTGTNQIPSMYRSFFVEVFLVDPDQQIPGQCILPGGGVRTYETAFGAALAGGFRNTELGQVTISSSGNRISQKWTIEEDSYELNLTSKDIP